MIKKRNVPRRVDPGSLPAIARRLRILRKTLAKTAPAFESQAEFARYVGLSRNAWCNYETGQGRIGVDAAGKLKIFGVRRDWIYDGDPIGMPHDLMVRLIETEREMPSESDIHEGVS